MVPTTPDRRSEWIRIDNGSLLCSCPDCHSPLTVRLWLRVADCWRCGTSLALEEIPGLLEALERDAADPAPVAPHAEVARAAARPAPVRPQPVVQPQPRPAPRSAPAAVAAPPRRLSLSGPLSPPQRRALRRSAWWSGIPAWLASLLLHLLLLIGLGLLTLPPTQTVEQIVLSTFVSPAHALGGVVALTADDDQPAFDQPLRETDQVPDPTERAVLIAAEQDARQLQLDPRAPAPQLPELSDLKRSIQQDGPRRMFAMRDPRVRAEVVRQEGGTTLTEAAVARGLRWLARHQAEDGSWSLHGFADHPQCHGRCDGAAQMRSDAAATALALLPFLGAGQTHVTGIYQDPVRRGLHWLLDQQTEDGDLRGDAEGQMGMYVQGQAAIVLGEAYAMTHDPQLQVAAQRAIDFIVRAQHRGGGWRYQPHEEGDTSVLGWELMALQSARAAGLRVPERTLRRARGYLDQVESDDEVTYAYQPGMPPTHVMTAEAILCRIYLGRSSQDERILAGLEWLLNEYPPQADDANIYYWDYATHSLHHCGGPLWDQWNAQMRDVLVATQEDDGHGAGSWSPAGPHSEAGGRIYMTALAICTLEVYYRHAPIFRRLDHDG